MKLIEALKKIQSLTKKAEDLRTKIGVYCAHLNYETPTYTNQGNRVKEWLQAHNDILKEILRLRVAIQKTNLETQVTIELGDNKVTHTIAEWIHRRRDLAEMDRKSWAKLTDKNLREGYTKNSQGEQIEVKIVRYYDASERDKNIDLYTNEPNIIDSRLEVVNAVTDLIE